MIFPFFWLYIRFKSLERYAYELYQFWGTSLFWLIGMPINKVYKGKLQKDKQYLFVPNHSSYLDIPAVGGGPFAMLFLGKIELVKIPVFGYIYKKLNIIVDRKNPRSRKKAMDDCRESLDRGYNLAIFPEGTISKQSPELLPFKDGAFLLAIEKGIPIVPVTLPYNWKILPGHHGDFTLRWHKNMVVYHEPIHTNDLTLKDIEKLKIQVHNVIQEEMYARNNMAFHVEPESKK